MSQAKRKEWSHQGDYEWSHQDRVSHISSEVAELVGFVQQSLPPLEVLGFGCNLLRFCEVRLKTRDRVWIPCPTDKQLVEPGYKWKSFREPTASDTTDPNFVQQEDKATHENPDEAQNKRSKRSKRAQRQFAHRDKYRVWAGTIEEAGLGSGMVLGSQCKQVTSP